MPPGLSLNSWRGFFELIGYILRRLLQMVPVLIGITLIAFIFLKLLPGDPLMIMTGGKATPEMREALHKRLGLDKPLPVQYGLFLIQCHSRRSRNFNNEENPNYGADR